jgi:putative ABC transport system permease protein
MVSDLLFRLRALVRRDAVEDELDAELRAHLERQIAVYQQAGMSSEEAARRARLEFGGLDQLKEACRDARGTRWFDDVGQDIRHAARMLRRDRWFTVTAVAVLALGIGTTTAMFTMINAALLRGLPVDDDRIVFLGTRDVHGREAGVSLADFEDWRQATRAFSGMSAYFDIAHNIGDDLQAAEMRSGPSISANAFRLLAVKPALGREFLPDDELRGAPRTVILGHGLWQSRYGGDPGVVGRTIRVDHRPAVVIGVMPERFAFPLVSDLWLPLGFAGTANAPLPARNVRTHQAFGRLADGVTIAEARAELETIVERLAQEYPATNAGIQPVVEQFSERFGRRPMRGLFLMLMGAVLFVLLIACANVATLLLARSAHRGREIAMRASLGASRGRIVRQLLVESLLLSTAAGLAGLGISSAAVRFILTQLPFTPYWVQWTPDGRVLAFLAITSVATGVLFGLAPALHLSRRHLSNVIKDAGRGSTSSRHTRRWANGLLVGEFALTLVLLTGAGLMMRSFVVLYRATLALDASDLVTMTVRVVGPKYPTPEQRKAFYRAIEERLAAIPDIASSTMASNAPFVGGYLRSLAIDGRPVAPDVPPPTVTYLTIGSHYFDTIGLRLLRGRGFRPRDGTPGHEHAIVNQRFVDMFLANEDPIGKRIRLTNTNVIATTLPWVTIVGVSPSVRQMSTVDDPDPVVYLPFQGDAGYFAALMVRPRGDVAAATTAIRAELAKLDPDIPLTAMMPLPDMMAFSRGLQRALLTLLGIFASLALVLASIGVYGVTAYAVAQRTQEIGVRVAIGARRSQVMWLFVSRSLVPLAVGLGLGVAGVLALGRVLESVLIQTSAADPLTLATVAMVVFLVALAASFFPARRATRLDPIAALRCE